MREIKEDIFIVRYYMNSYKLLGFENKQKKRGIDIDLLKLIISNYEQANSLLKGYEDVINETNIMNGIKNLFIEKKINKNPK